MIRHIKAEVDQVYSEIKSARNRLVWTKKALELRDRVGDEILVRDVDSAIMGLDQITDDLIRNVIE